MGHITYVRGAGSPIVIILCYFLEKNNYLFHTFFTQLKKPFFKIISHSEKGFLVFNHIVALNVAPRSINTVETPYFWHFTLSATSLSGIFLIAKLTLVYPCKPLENGLSRILYTWILLDVFLTFVRPKDVIRLKIRLFILCMYCCVKHNNTQQV